MVSPPPPPPIIRDTSRLPSQRVLEPHPRRVESAPPTKNNPPEPVEWCEYVSRGEWELLSDCVEDSDRGQSGEPVVQFAGVAVTGDA